MHSNHHQSCLRTLNEMKQAKVMQQSGISALCNCPDGDRLKNAYTALRSAWGLQCFVSLSYAYTQAAVLRSIMHGTEHLSRAERWVSDGSLSRCSQAMWLSALTSNEELWATTKTPMVNAAATKAKNSAISGA